MLFLSCHENILKSLSKVEAAQNYKSAENYKNRQQYMTYLVKNIDQYVDDQRRYETRRNKNKFLRCLLTTVPCFGRFMGNYVVILYFIVKLLYIVNTCAQVFLLSGLLGKSFWCFGYDFIVKLLTGHGWTVSNSKYFPSN